MQLYYMKKGVIFQSHFKKTPICSDDLYFLLLAEGLKPFNLYYFSTMSAVISVSFCIEKPLQIFKTATMRTAQMLFIDPQVSQQSKNSDYE